MTDDTSDYDHDSTDRADDDRIERLTEQVDQLKSEVQQVRQRCAVTDAQGREWTPEDIKAVAPQLTRRQAMAAFAALAIYGGSIYSAIQFGAERAAAADTSTGQVGAANDSVDVVLDEIRDEGGDVVADIDDTGDIDWQSRGFDNLGSVDTDQLSGADIANASTDEVPKSDGSGGLTMGSVGGGLSGTTSSAGLSLGGGYQVVDSNNPGWLMIVCQVGTDGSNDGKILLRVDESGGSSFDYDYIINIPPETGTDAFLQNGYTIYLPQGASIKPLNQSDPTNANKIQMQRFIAY